MSIIQLNEEIINFLHERDLKSEQELLELSALSQQTTDIFLITEIENKKNIILNQHRALDFFILTNDIFEEYTRILKSPISHCKEQAYQPLLQKNILTRRYLDICRIFIKTCDISENANNLFNMLNKQPEESLCKCGNNDEHTINVEYGSQVCTICSVEQSFLELGNCCTDYNRINFVGRFVYNRIIHFQDCIKQYQGKQKCNIPSIVFTELDKKFEAYRLIVPGPDIIRYSKICRNDIVMFLKELKLTKQYENVNKIYFIFTNKRIDDIDYLEDVLLDDFKQLIILYDKYRNVDINRKNFMNAQYILFQLLKRHNHPCRSENFSMLKTLDRKMFHDKICEFLFNILGWKFTPTF